MYIDVDKLGIYQLVKEKGEAKGMEKGRAEYQQEIILQLLKKFSPEQVAELSGVSLEKVRDSDALLRMSVNSIDSEGEKTNA